VGVAAAVPSVASAAPGDDAPSAQRTDSGSDGSHESTPTDPPAPPPPPPTSPEITVPPTPPETTVPAPPETPPPAPEPPTTPPVDTVPPAPQPPPVTAPPPAPDPPDAPDAPDEPDVEPPAPTVPPPDELPLPDETAQPLPDGPLRTIAFPVLGPVQYSNDWGQCRAGCARRHEGTDLIGVRMQPLLAAVDGTITRIRHENVGTAGTTITVTGADGWYYNYFHLNNDTPGTDDGAAGHEWQVPPHLTVGSRVRAGQVIAYMGDSGNAEGSVPHLHFEIRTPDRIPVNPYHSLVAAQGRETCAPVDAARTFSENAAALSRAAVAIIPIDGGGRWLIDPDGRLFAEGPAARIEPIAGIDCDTVEPVAMAVTRAADTVASDAEALPRAEPVQPVQPVPAVQPFIEPGQPVQPVDAPVETPQPVLEPVQPVLSVGEPAPASPVAPTANEWTVAPGESLWGIVQEAYGASDVAATVSLIDTVFDFNRDQLWHPDELEIGMTLQLPNRPA
jgi:hypothetical protein